ncbi:sugar-binding protein [candidate division KSB1 bacterium]
MKKLIVFFAIISILFGCSKTETYKNSNKDSDIEIAIVSNALVPFWVPMGKGMEDAGEKLGVKVSWKGPENSQLSEQLRIIENYVSKGVNGIAISPINQESLVPIINSIVEKGIVVLTMDSDAPESKRFAYIGTDNYNAGKQAGKTMLKVLPGGGKVAVFVGNLSAQNAIDRLQGFRDSVKGSNIEIVKVYLDDADKGRSRSNVENALQKYKDIKGLLGLYSYNAPSIADAVIASDLAGKVKIVGFDAEPATLIHLENNVIDAAIVQKPYYFGYLSVQIIYNIIKMGSESTGILLPKNRIIDTGVETITPENAKDYKNRLKELGVESS